VQGPVARIKYAYRSGSVTALLVIMGALTACQAPTQSVDEASDEITEVAPVLKGTWEYGAAMRSPEFENALREQRVIADTLYEGIKALNANRLLTPPEISAYRYFSQVLAVDPSNAVAKQGIQDIAAKYLQLAEQAGRQGQFDSAKTFLSRAEQVDSFHAGLAPAKAMLEAEINSTDLVMGISAAELSRQSPALVGQLEEIAIKARDSGAFVLITAPNDTQGRWIYAQMQAAVQGYRLRANIELGETPTIRLVKSTGGDA